MGLKAGNSSKSALTPYRYTPGVTYWPEHIWGTSEPLKQDVEIEMGNIYTKDANGYIIKVVAASGTCQLERGIFQASRSWTNTKFPEGEKAASADTADGQRKMLFWGLDSFVILKARSAAVPGQIVDLYANGATVTPDTVVGNTTGVKTRGSIGVLQDILKLSADSRDASTDYDDRTRPARTGTGNDDLVVVRLGVR